MPARSRPRRTSRRRPTTEATTSGARNIGTCQTLSRKIGTREREPENLPLEKLFLLLRFCVWLGGRRVAVGFENDRRLSRPFGGPPFGQLLPDPSKQHLTPDLSALHRPSNPPQIQHHNARITTRTLVSRPRVLPHAQIVFPRNATKRGHALAQSRSRGSVQL